jgi:hypothetical protein
MIHETGTYAIIENGNVTAHVFWDGKTVEPGGGDLPNTALPYSQIHDTISDSRLFYWVLSTIITDSEVVDHFVSTLKPAAAEMLESMIADRIETLRGQAITLSPGQSMEYQQKLEEAVRVLADPTHAKIKDFPVLASTEVAVYNRTLVEAAELVVNAKMHSQRQITAAAAVRAKLKHQMVTAKDDTERYAAFASFDFDRELQLALSNLDRLLAS